MKKINIKIMLSFFTVIFLFLTTCVARQEVAESETKVSTLQIVKDRGKLICGVSTGLPGFSAPNSAGTWQGLDVDVCRAVAAAVLGDDSKIEYVPLNAKERFTALQSGQVDLLVRNTTWTATRDTSLGIIFAGVNYYDGQGFMVKKAMNVKKGTDLNGASFCIQAGTTTELNLADYFRANNIKYKAVTFDTSDQTIKGFQEGRCDALTSDHSQLSALRTQLSDPNSAVVLSEVISKEPLGPSVRQGDDQWLNIVKWSLYALIEAEELGLTSRNVSSVKGDPNASPTVKRFLGIEDTLGENLGLSNDWVYNIISMVGNYDEVFQRNVGSGSPLNIKRAGSVNDSWKRGGLHYPMPFR